MFAPKELANRWTYMVIFTAKRLIIVLVRLITTLGEGTATLQKEFGTRKKTTPSKKGVGGGRFPFSTKRAIEASRGSPLVN